MFKRTFAAIMILAAMLCVTVQADARDKDDSWLVYMYISGTNLEEGGHQATNDIANMQHVKLPPNIKVLLYVGGSKEWHHPTIAAGGDGIYLYSSNRLEKLTDSEAENMGDPNTLATFLEYGEENFPADHRIIIFQNHGGVNGICYDDKFAQEVKSEDGQTGKIVSFLTYDALKETFGVVYGDSPDNPPIELVAFNACLTGSYELANSIADFSRYMIGSEPSSFPVGWDFQSLFGALAKDTSMDGAQLGKAICDSTMKRYNDPSIKNYKLRAASGFSVIDLGKMPELREAYQAYFDEAIARAVDDDSFSAAFARAAQSRKVDKYSNLYTDLGLLAKNTKSIMPDASGKLLKAIDKAVVYNKHGDYLNSRGISTYYPYTSLGIGYNGDSVISVTNENGDETDFAKNFLNMNSNYDGQKNFYRKLFGLDFSDFDAVPLRNSNGHFVATLTPEQLENVSSIQCVMFPLTAGNGDSGFGPINFGGAILTSIDDLKINWKKGTVTENFRGVEPVFDGHKILMNPVSGGRGNTFYEVPILYNGDYRDFIVRYDTSAKKYEIVGFGDMIENGMVRQLYFEQPTPGAVITPIYYTIVSEDSVSPGDETIVRRHIGPDPQTGKFACIKWTLGEPFVYTKDSAITERKINKGVYVYTFRFIAPNGNDASSDPGFIGIEYGKTYRFTQEELKARQQEMSEAKDAA